MRAWLLLVVGLSACREPIATPVWTAPSSAQEQPRRQAALDAERERWLRERRERQLDAVDPGELIEHARNLPQSAIDDGSANVERIFRVGETMFERRFTIAEGLGHGPVAVKPGLSRVQGETRGPDALSCIECHHRGGDDGAGELHHRAWLGGDGVHLSSASPRVAPHLAGLGLVQVLAAEMSSELAQTRAAMERDPGASKRFPLQSKGVSFGALLLAPDGGVDTSQVEGVDADLIVRPFGWKGAHATLRTFVRAALPQHMGMEPLPPTDDAAKQPWLHDEDADGVAGELHEGQLTALSVYLALLDVPQVRPPGTPELRGAWAQGRLAFTKLGCEACHRASLALQGTSWVERAEGRDAGVRIDVVADVQVAPALEQLDYARMQEVPLFSDLRRHDLGAALATPAVDGGVAPQLFVTRPLWGLGTRGNAYLHDGRARTIDAAVLAHGGEAQPAANAFREASEEDRAAVRVFLLSLRRQPMARLQP